MSDQFLHPLFWGSYVKAEIELVRHWYMRQTEIWAIASTGLIAANDGGWEQFGALISWTPNPLAPHNASYEYFVLHLRGRKGNILIHFDPKAHLFDKALSVVVIFMRIAVTDGGGMKLLSRACEKQRVGDPD